MVYFIRLLSLDDVIAVFGLLQSLLCMMLFEVLRG